MNCKNITNEPLRSLPREMSVKYSKDSTNYFNESMLKDRNFQGNYYIKKPHTSVKGLPPEKSFTDSIGIIGSGTLAIVRGVENRNSGGSSSVATPNSPQQSPLSPCSSSGGKSSDNQLYEDGLSEEELRQIAIRQQRQIQLQIEDLRQKQQQITHLKQQIEKKSKFPKVSQSIIQLKDVYEQQDQKINMLRSSKNQLSQSRSNCGALKTDIGNVQNIVNSKKQDLKKTECRNEEMREYIQYVHQNCISSNSILPDFETFIRHKNSSAFNIQKSNSIHSSDHGSQGLQTRVKDSPSGCYSMQISGSNPEHTKIYVRHNHNSENYSNSHFQYNNLSEISAFATFNSAFRSKQSDISGTTRPPPLPAHSYQRSTTHILDNSILQPSNDVGIIGYQHKDKRPPLPSYSDATLISANNKISMLLSQASRGNADTPTSSPPVLRRSSIVGLPYGKMPSRFASRNTINNVYIKKSSQESLERYKKTASEMYKAQLSKFKSSSTDDVRVENTENVISATETVYAVSKTEIFHQEEQMPDPPNTDIGVSVSITQDNSSICSSCSSLSLPEDLIEEQASHSVQTDDVSTNDVAISLTEAKLDNNEVEDFDCLLWDKSVRRALEALTKEPEKMILKKFNNGTSQSLNKRHAYFHPHSLLLDAALEAEFDLVKEMANKVDNISEATDEGITALHNAVCSGREDIVKFLLDLGAHVNAGDTDGWTPLHCAASCNNVSMAKLLVEYGASLLATSISDSEIPLQKCEADDDTECENYLLGQQDLLGVINDGKVFSLFHYEPNHVDELLMYPNQKLRILNKEPQGEPGWFLSVDCNGTQREGLVPKAYVSCYHLTLPKK